jgi:hypothetical protein
MRTSPVSHPTRSFTADQTLGLKEYQSNQQPDFRALLPASPILNRGERVVTNKIMGHFIDSAKLYS